MLSLYAIPPVPGWEESRGEMTRARVSLAWRKAAPSLAFLLTYRYRTIPPNNKTETVQAQKKGKRSSTRDPPARQNRTDDIVSPACPA